MGFIQIAIICLLLVSIFFVLYKIYTVYKRSLHYKRRQSAFDNYDNLITILNTSKHLAYDKIFREELLVWLHSKIKTDETNVDKYEREYIETVLMYCGEAVVEDLVCIYGDENALLLNLATEFTIKLIKDETNIGKLLSNDT